MRSKLSDRKDTTGRSRKRRAVVDTNLIISGTINKRGQPFALIEAWRQRRFTLVMSAEQREEVAVVLGRPRIRLRYQLAADEIVLLLQLLDSDTSHILPRRRLPVHVRDKKDDPILAAALGGKANYLVTGDDDLLVLRGDPRIKSLQIVTVRDFLGVLSGSG